MSITRVVHQHTPRVVVIGSLTEDHVICDGNHVRQIGGVVWHAGKTFSKMGVETRVVTRAASKDYEFGQALKAEGIKVWSGSSTKTTTFVNEYTAKVRGERTQRVLALADPIEPDDFYEALTDADLVYLGPLHPADLSESTLSFMCQKTPSCLALDVQGYTRFVQNGFVLPKLDTRLLSLLNVCNVVKANEEEACLITGMSDAESAALNLAYSHPSLEVVVTCGTKGVYVTQSEAIHFVESKTADVHDTTGAGDIFFASYITHRLNGILTHRAAELAGDFTAERLLDPDRVVIL